IGFAGPRVIEQTIREKLPEGFQKSEYLREHGMVDMVVHRHELRATLANLCRLLTKAPAAPPTQVAAPAPALPALPAPVEERRFDRARYWRSLPRVRGRAGGVQPRTRHQQSTAPCMTHVDAILARLLALHPKRIDLSLDRMWRILDALGHPERRLPPVIHVAGTNGKGSTVAFMRAMLEAAGK